MEENIDITGTVTGLAEAEKNFELKHIALMEAMNKLVSDTRLFKLLPEEVSLITEFRKFKTTLKKPKVFTFMTRPFEPET